MRFEDKIAIVTGRASGIGKELAKRTPANNRAVMLIGDGRETNPASEFHAWFESIDDVVGKLVRAGCQGDGTSPNVQSYAGPSSQMPIVQGREVSFGRHVIGGLLPNARDPLANAWTNYSKK